MQRKSWVGAAQASNEVVFPDADGSLGGICAMHMRRDELIIHSFGFHELLEACWTFVVKLLEKWAEAACGKFGVQLGVGSHKFVFTAGFEGLGQNVIAVVVVDDHDVLVAFAGGDRETARLVAEYLP